MNDIIDALKDIQAEPQLTTVGSVPVLALPPGWSELSLEKHLEAPSRARAAINITNLASFVEYVNRFKLPDASIIKFQCSAEEFECTGIIDYHSPENGPARCEHTVFFGAVKTPAWAEWRNADGSLMRQSAFSDFLYRNQVDITTPGGAELLEIITTLKATSKGEFQDIKDLHTGSQELIYRVKVSAQGGTNDRPIELPKQFEVTFIPFYGCPPITLRADLLIHAPKSDGEAVHLSYRLYRRQDVFERLFETLAGKLREDTKLPVFIC